MFHVPGKYNGGEGPGYAWTQTQSEVELRAPLPAGAEGSVRCTFSARSIALSWADAAVPLDAELSALVAPDDCLWSIEEEAGAKTVVVSLRKQVKAVWSRLLESDAEPAEAPRLIDGAERSTPKTKAELLADAKARAKGALDEELGKAKLHMVEGRSGEVITLTAAEMPALPVLYVQRCDDCQVELPEGASALKIQLQGCKRSVLRVRGKVLTETLEVWECEGCTVEAMSRLATVQVDACTLALALTLTLTLALTRPLALALALPLPGRRVHPNPSPNPNPNPTPSASPSPSPSPTPGRRVHGPGAALRPDERLRPRDECGLACRPG